VKDEGGTVIPNADVAWDVDPVGSGTLDPPTNITYPPGGQQVSITFEGGTSNSFLVTATAGAASDTQSVV
jgi:hypothetical protein